MQRYTFYISLYNLLCYKMLKKDWLVSKQGLLAVHSLVKVNVKVKVKVPVIVNVEQICVTLKTQVKKLLP